MESEVYRMWELEKNVVLFWPNPFIFHWSEQTSSCYLIVRNLLPTEITHKSLCIQRFKPQTAHELDGEDGLGRGKERIKTFVSTGYS